MVRDCETIQYVAFSLRFQLVPSGLSNCPEPANKRKWKEPEQPLLRLIF